MNHESFRRSTIRPRLLLVGLVILIVIASIWSGTRFFGTVDAGLEVERTPFGPVKFGMDGMFGEKAKPSEAMMPTPTPSSAGQVAYSPPYHGPSAEETRVLAEMQAVVNRIWKKDRRLLLAAGQDVRAPQLQLPQRALTDFELQQMRETTKRLKDLEE